LRPARLPCRGDPHAGHLHRTAASAHVVYGDEKLSNLVIDFLRNDIVWLVFYVAFAATIVERSITWLFFSERAGGMTLRVVVDLLSTGVILGTLFSVWLWLAIAENTFRTVTGKLIICLLMIGLLCNWVLLYAIAYSYLGLIDGETAVREPITCLYFSIVT
jgi:fatty acid desaturase